MKKTMIMGLVVVLTWVAGVSYAKPFIYPQNGQSAQQQQTDERECDQWARGQTGYDPTAQPVQGSAPPQGIQRDGQVVRGAARGALFGAVVDGDTGKAAVAGAVAGGMRQRGVYRRQQEAYANQQQQIQAQQQALYNDYNRAVGTCLQARGYSVG